MKKSSCLSTFVAATAFSAALVSLPAPAHAQTWTGNLSNDFNAAGNWNSALGTNSTLQIHGPGTQGNRTLTNGSYTFTGTGGKISFGSSSANMTLSGGTVTLFQGTGDGILSAVTAGNTTTIASDIILGNGSAATNSLSMGATGQATSALGVLNITGNITGGTGGTPGALVLSFGSTASFNGTYTVAGNISAGGAASIAITSRGGGVKELSGTNTVNFVNYGTTAASADLTGTFRVTGGTTNINVATDGTNGWGNSGANGGAGTNTFQVSGGVVNATAGRSIDPSIVVDGGTLNFNSGATRFSLNSGATFTLSSGAVNFNPTTGTFGVRFGGDNGPGAAGQAFTGSQSGGTFTVNGAGGQDTTFSLGSNSTGIVNSYNLSGGTLDVKGTGSNAFVTLGADSTATSNTTLSLSGTGKLIVRSATTAGSPGSASVSGIQGRNSSAVQVLSLTGGTLVAGRIDATNLRGSLAGTNGTIVNNGSSIAPGDIGSAGRTAVVGGLTLTSGTLVLDIGGTTAATNWQESTTSFFDNIAVTGNVILGGNLSLNLIGGFDPIALNSFTVLTSGGLSGAFSNVAFGTRLLTAGGEGSFLVTQSGNNVVLTDYEVIPEPSTWALIAIGGTALVVLRRRHSRS